MGNNLYCFVFKHQGWHAEIVTALSCYFSEKYFMNSLTKVKKTNSQATPMIMNSNFLPQPADCRESVSTHALFLAGAWVFFYRLKSLAQVTSRLMSRFLIGIVFAATLTGFSQVLHAQQGTYYSGPTTDWYHANTNYPHDTRLWVPSGTNIIKGLIIIGNTAMGDARWTVEKTDWQAFARTHDFALMGTRNYACTRDFLVNDELPILLNDLTWYANQSGRPEIKNLPFILTGWSGGGQIAYGINTQLPQRVIAHIVNKGSNIIFPPLSTNALKTPNIIVGGQLDGNSLVTFKNIFEANRNSGGFSALAPEQNTGHMEGNVNGMWFTFFDHAIRARYPTNTTPLSNTVTLLNLSETNGWLAAQPTTTNGLSGSVYAYTNYPGIKTNAGWLMDQDVANLYRGFTTYNPAATVTVVGGPIFTEAQKIQFQVSVDSTKFPNWLTADVYDGATKLGTVTNGGPTSVYAFRPWGGRGATVIVRDGSGNERTSIPMPFVVKKNSASAWNNGSGNFLWNTTTPNWSGSNWSSGTDAVFGATGVGTITVSGTVPLADSTTSLCIDAPGYKIVGGTLALPQNPSGPLYFNVNANAEISSVITGNSQLHKNGNGTLTLTSSNTYANHTWLNAGAIKLGPGGHIGNYNIIGTAAGATLAIGQNANGTTNRHNGFISLAAGANFTMADGYTSKFIVAGSDTSSLSVTNYLIPTPPVLTFDIGSTNQASDTLVISSAATIINKYGQQGPLPTIVANLLGTPSSSTNTYTLITAARGLVGAKNYKLTPKNVTIAGNPYYASLTNSTDTAVILSFVPGTIIIPYYWKGGIDGKWTSENFKLDAAGTSATTELPNSATSVYMTASTANNRATTLEQPFSINGLIFSGTGTANTAGSSIGAGSGGRLQINSGGITVDAGSGTNTISAPITLGEAQSWINNSTKPLLVSAVTNGGFPITIAGSGNTTISGALTGSGSLTKSASGILTLSGSNAYTGPTTISAGTLAIANSKALAGGGIVTLVGGTLDLGSLTSTTPFSLQGGTMQRGVISNNSGNFDIRSGREEWNGRFSGSAGLIKTTPGTAYLMGVNTYTGPTTIYDGTLTIANHRSIYDPSTITNPNVVSIVGGALDLNNTNVIFRISLKGGTLQNGSVTYWGGNFDIQSGMEAANAVLADASAVWSGYTAGLIKTTTNTAILAGSNTYTGPTIISAGTLQLNGSIARSVTVQGGGTLTGTGTIHQNLIVASNGVVKLDSGTFTVKGSITNNGTIILNNGAQIRGYSSFNGNVVVTNSGLSNQTITFPSIPAQTYGSGPMTVTLSATASSGLPVSYNSSSTNISLSSNVATILGAGTATITATQNGNSSWNAAIQVGNQLVVNTNSLVSIIPVVNGSFETPGVLVGGPWARFGNAWSISNSPSSYQQIQAVSGGIFTNTPNGSWVALINNDDTPITAPLTQNLGTNVTNGDILSITFSFGRQKGTSPGGQGVAYFDVGGTKYTMPFDASVLSPGGWQTTNITKTITNSGLLSLGFYATSGHGTNAWVDNISNVTRTPALSQQKIIASQSVNPSQKLLVTAPAVAATASGLLTNQRAGIGIVSAIPSIPVRPTIPLQRPTNIGSVVAWGNSTYAQTNVPAGLTNVVQLSTWGLHSLALNSSGTVTAWGWNAYGQTTVPASLTNAAQVAAGASFSAALRTNGSIIAWGNNSLGQTNIPVGLTNAVQIAAGSDHALALRSDGTVTAWGWNAYNQCNVPTNATNVVQVAAGYFHSVALKANGTVQAWGNNTYGETNVPAGLTNVVRIATGLSHTVALKKDGSVVVWGWNNAGQTNVPAGLRGAVQIASGGNTVFAVTTNGTLVSWGDNSYGQANPPSVLTNVMQFVIGLYHAIGLKK
jgi:autotransporter-associated beta strand protein